MTVQKWKGIKRCRATFTSFLLAMAGFFALALGIAQAAPQALINDSTVSGGASSVEAQVATAQGYVVTVVSDATWGAMTAAQFGSYDLLILGDPSCSTLPPGLVASAPVFGPVVLGTAGGRTLPGNRIVIGTDPVLHGGDATTVDDTMTGARGKIIRTGIAFAGKQPGRTGLYFDVTCAAPLGQSAQILTILGAISAGTGAWTVDASPPCGGNVSLIASEPSFATLTTASLAGWGCSVHESFPTFPTDFSALAVATDTATTPTCGKDPNTGLSACGEAYILIAGSSIIVTSGSISVSPLDVTNPVGTMHTVTAHVTTSAGVPIAGQVVTFSITGVNAGVAGTCVPVGCVTDASGNVSFTYPDTNGAGNDTIKASFTDAAGSLQSATAQKHWVGVTNRPPVAICKDVIVIAGSTCTAAANINNGSFDPDAVDTITVTQSPAGPYALGMTTVTLTVTDNHGASSSCIAKVTVLDKTPPVITCPSDATVDAASAAGVIMNFAAAATDNCDPSPVVTYSQNPGTLFPIGTTTVTATATDASGNMSSCTFKITVRCSRAIELDVLAQLRALLPTVTDKKAARELAKAIGEFNEANNPAWWTDDCHAKCKYGKHVFDEKSEAVDELAELVHDYPALAGTLSPLIAREVLAARILAEISLKNATGNNLARGLKSLAAGDKDLARGKVEDAIEDYGDAWQYGCPKEDDHDHHDRD